MTNNNTNHVTYCDTEDLVKDFHEKYGLTVNNNPTFLSDKDKELRIRLIKEELDELVEALETGDHKQILKEACDLQYVLDGFFVSAGYWYLKRPIFDEVHKSNMTKDGSKDAGGKITKGPNYKPPNLSKWID